MKLKTILSLFLVHFITVSAQAQLSNSVSVGYDQSAEPQADGSRDKSLGILWAPSFVHQGFKLSGKFIYGYDLNHPEADSDWADGVISLNTSLIKPFKAVKTIPSVSVELPFSKESREMRGVNYVVNAGLTLSLDTKYLNMEKFSLSYGASYGHFQNDYTTRANGDPATKSKISQSFATGYNFDPVSINLAFQFVTTYSYDDVIRNGFFHMESISYKVTEVLGFSLYHYNKGSYLKAKTYENNLKAYDKASSTIGLSADLSL